MRKRKERVEKWREEQRKKAMENIGELKKEIEEMKQGKKWSLEDDDGITLLVVGERKQNLSPVVCGSVGDQILQDNRILERSWEKYCSRDLLGITLVQAIHGLLDQAKGFWGLFFFTHTHPYLRRQNWTGILASLEKLLGWGSMWSCIFNKPEFLCERDEESIYGFGTPSS